MLHMSLLKVVLVGPVLEGGKEGGVHEPGRETFGRFCAPAFEELWDELHGPEYGTCVWTD
jgi:hypothetical protein